MERRACRLRPCDDHMSAGAPRYHHWKTYPVYMTLWCIYSVHELTKFTKTSEKKYTYCFHLNPIIYKISSLNSLYFRCNEKDRICDKFKLENWLNVLFFIMLKFNEVELKILYIIGI